MLVGIIELDIHIPFSQSLKQKRSILKRLKNKLRENFNASVVEAEYKNKWQRSVIALAILRESRNILDAHFQSIVDYVSGYPEVELLSWEMEVF